MRRLPLLLAALVIAAPSGAAIVPGVLKPGDRGQRVCDLHWLLSGKKPSVFRGISTYSLPVQHGRSCRYLNETKKGVYRMKYRLGWPEWSLRSSGYTAGPLFQAILRGKQPRPVPWIAIAAKRVAAPKPTTDICDLRVREEALKLLATGVHEVPDGSNRDGQVLHDIQAVTGAFSLAWCVSTGQYIALRAGIGTFADRTAGVFYAVGWARDHGLLNARPKIGAGVAFLDGQGHYGTVVAVTAHGFVSVEGNHSNRISEVFHEIGARPEVFIYYQHPPGGCR